MPTVSTSRKTSSSSGRVDFFMADRITRLLRAAGFVGVVITALKTSAKARIVAAGIRIGIRRTACHLVTQSIIVALAVGGIRRCGVVGGVGQGTTAIAFV